VVSLTITRWPHLRAQARRQGPVTYTTGRDATFGGTTGARLGYLCHTVFAASSAAV